MYSSRCIVHTSVGNVSTCTTLFAGVAFSPETTSAATLQACKREVHGPAYGPNQWLSAVIHAAYPAASTAEIAAMAEQLQARCKGVQTDLMQEIVMADGAASGHIDGTHQGGKDLSF